MNRFLKLVIMVVVGITTAFLLFPKIVKDYRKMPFMVEEPLKYYQESITINGNPQFINCLEIKLKDKRVDILPVLSQNSIFGFEKTSTMSKRMQAKAAINGGFFHIYGQPSGITIIKGELLCTPWQTSPRALLLIDDEGIAHMIDTTIKVWVESGHVLLPIDGVNRKPQDNEIIIYSPKYGLTTRTNGIETLSTTVRNNIISEYLTSDMQVSIPQEGTVIIATGEKKELLKTYTEQNKGNSMTIEYKLSSMHNKIIHAVEGGFWIVKDGLEVIKEKEGWVGLTTNREPRTIVGLKDDGTVIFLTIDGRQPGYSLGVTGDELAQFLIKQGINNALMLDGGASTTMVVDGKVVNKPSYRGRERMVGGAICIIYEE